MAIKWSQGAVHVTKVMGAGGWYWNPKTLMKYAVKVKGQLGATCL